MRPRCSRYQFRVSTYVVVCSTTWPSRWTLAGSRGGRCVAFARGSFVAEVEHLRRLGRQGCELVGVGDDPHRHPARVGQVHGEPADALRQLLDLRPGGVGQPHHVGGVRGPEGRTQVPRPRSTAHDHARRAGVGPAQLELVRRPAHGGEPERVREALRGGQVGLGELEPGQVEHLDDGVLRAARVLAAQRTLLAVQVAVGPVVTGHLLLLKLVTDDIITHEGIAQSRVLRKSSFLTEARRWRRRRATMTPTPGRLR